jgi:hypothetical protein
LSDERGVLGYTYGRGFLAASGNVGDDVIKKYIELRGAERQGDDKSGSAGSLHAFKPMIRQLESVIACPSYGCLGLRGCSHAHQPG